jgi:Phosphatidate phosphatase APP1, catalytic domain
VPVSGRTSADVEVIMVREKLVTLFPTYGFQNDTSWTVPVRVWVHKARRVDHISDDHIRALLFDDEGLPLPTEEEIIRCRKCIADFVADSDSGERVVLLDDAGHELLTLPKTDANGLAEGELRLPSDRSGHLTIMARVTGTLGGTFDGKGLVMLLEPQGKSIVSDIDDTIKVTEIPAGKAIVLRNTFLRPYFAAEGMRDRYRGLGDVSFHYVSGSPWQLFGLLHSFLIEQAGFPQGTFHMKSLRTSLLDLPSFIADLKNMLMGKDATKEQKIQEISVLMDNLRHRQFTLIGDSGELDPEVFTELRKTRGTQVEKIIIRDVVDARHTAPQRLQAVDEIIEVPAIQRGMSQST